MNAIKDITLKGEGYSMNRIPINLFGIAKIINKKNGERIIAGYANLAVVDSQNQLIPTESLKAGIETLMTDLSYANLMLHHKNIQIGKILPEWGELKTHVDDKGLFIVAEIRKDTEIGNDIWKQIINGEINGFSIGCEVVSEPVTKCDTDGENCIEILNDINIFEVSLTNFPANEMSGFVVVSKSNYDKGDLDLTSYNNVCDECSMDKGIMSKKKKVKSETKEEVDDKTRADDKPQEEEKTDEVELSIESRMENLERLVSNMEAVISKLAGSEEEEKSDEPVEEKAVEPEPEPEPEVEDKSGDEMKEKVDTIVQGMSELTEKLSGLFTEKSKEQDAEKLKEEIEELKLAVKARDDDIAAKDKKIEVLTKSEEKEEPKTVKKSDDEEDTGELQQDERYVVKNGEVYLL